MSTGPFTAFALAVGGLQMLATPALAQTNLKAVAPYYARLQNVGNYSTFDGGSTYYKWSTSAPLPNQRKVSYQIGGRTISDMTRVGAGQCVDFIKEVTNTTGTAASSWIKGDPAVVNNQIAAIAGGTALATFDDRGKYNNGHCIIVLARSGDTLIVADQNYISGLDRAKAVGRHPLTIEQLKKYSIIKVN